MYTEQVKELFSEEFINLEWILSVLPGYISHNAFFRLEKIEEGYVVRYRFPHTADIYAFDEDPVEACCHLYMQLVERNYISHEEQV